MMRSNISRLAVLGLAAISSSVFAAVSLSGQVRLDTMFKSEPTEADDSMGLSRVRLNLKGDIASDWTAGARLEGSSGTVLLQRAFASWTGLDNHTVTLGRTGHTTVHADASYYAPYTTGHGTLSGFSGDKVGLSVAGSMGALGYKLGLANEAIDDDTAANDNLNFSFGARAHFTAMNSDNMSWGLGLGLVDNKREGFDVILTDTDAADAGGTPTVTNYTTEVGGYNGMTVDVSGVMGKVAMTGGLYTAKDKFVTASTLANNPFDKDGKATSYYVEASYLVMGDGYGFKSALVSGPKFKSSALELGARFSNKVLKNVSVGDISDDLTAFDPTNLDATSEIKHETNATSVFANYHVNSNAVVKVEYYNSKMKDKRTNFGTAAADVKNKHLSVRAQFSF